MTAVMLLGVVVIGGAAVVLAICARKADERDRKGDWEDLADRIDAISDLPSRHHRRAVAEAQRLERAVRFHGR